MTTRNLYASVNNITDILSVDISDSHSASMTTAVVECRSHNLTLGDSITIDIGYTDDHQEIFTGYVKEIVRRTPHKTYIITAKDVLVRAVDFFIVAENPESPFSRRNILAENLVRDVLALAGLTDYDYDPTFFRYATGEMAAEVNLVSAYDYSNGLAELLTWHLYADNDGTVHFVNRKPYVMTGDTNQPGDTTDERPAGQATMTLTNANILEMGYRETERDLRNRVVIYGASGVYAEAHASSPYLPAGFYKTAVLSSSIIARSSYAQTAAEYNLDRWNRLGYEVSMSIIGIPSIRARSIIRLNETILGTPVQNWYVFSADHNWSSNGYINSLVLRR